MDIATIREANNKLLERKMLKLVVEQQDTIILNQYDIIDSYMQENLYLASLNIDLNKQYEKTVKLNNELDKRLQRTKIGLYVVGGVSITTISYIIIKTIINGK